MENREHLLPLMRSLEARVAALRSALERGDAVALEAELAAGRAARARFMREG
jgi:hypothetical protein